MPGGTGLRRHSVFLLSHDSQSSLSSSLKGTVGAGSVLESPEGVSAVPEEG